MRERDGERSGLYLPPNGTQKTLARGLAKKSPDAPSTPLGAAIIWAIEQELLRPKISRADTYGALEFSYCLVLSVLVTSGFSRSGPRL